MIFLDSIVCGDNMATMKQMPDGCIDLTVTSPPYDNLRTYAGHDWNFEIVARELFRITKHGGVVVWVVADATKDGSETGTSFRQALFFKEVGFNLHDTMIYEKRGQHMQRFGHKKYPGAWEYVFVLTHGMPKTFNPLRDIPTVTRGKNSSSIRQPDGTMKPSHSVGRQTAEIAIRSNVWSYAVGDRHTDTDGLAHLHPAAFPEKLAADHILSWSNAGDTVFDPFSGSGTTCKMAKELARHWIGIEINPEYIEISNKRMRQDVLSFGS